MGRLVPLRRIVELAGAIVAAGAPALSQCPAGMEAPRTFHAGPYVLNAHLTDLDGDGVLDAAMTNQAPGMISVLLGNADGSFDDPIVTSLGTDWPWDVTSGDLDGDGMRDLVVTRELLGEVTVLPGNGDGTFAAPISYAWDVASGLAVADLDLDGDEDVIVGDAPGLTITAFLGNGDGTLQPGISSGTVNWVRSLAVADLTGDGIPDVALVTGSGDKLQVLAGAGDGTFAPAGTYQLVSEPWELRIARLDGDAVPDIVVALRAGMALQVLLGTGGGGLAPPVSLPRTSGSTDLALGDLDGDGDADIVASGSVGAFLGNGDGSFGSEVTASFSAREVGLADTDGDGTLDLVGTLGELLFVAKGRGDGTFVQADVVPLAAVPRAIVAVDLDRDGHKDLAVASTLPAEAMIVLPGRGDGTVGAARSYAGPDSLEALVAGDWNSDAWPDLAAVSAGRLYVLRNDGAGGLGSFTEIGSGGSFLAAGDVDADGALDLCTDAANGQLAIFLGDGMGGFGAPVYTYPGRMVLSVRFADLDADELDDLLVGASDGLQVFLGNGDGTFRAGASLVPGAYVTHIEVGRLDPGTALDVVAGALSRIHVLMGRGDGTFESPATVDLEGFAYGLAASDVNGDGAPDLAATREHLDVVVLAGIGDGTFAPPRTYLAEGREGLAAADMDEDGATDLVTAAGLQPAVTILLAGAMAIQPASLPGGALGSPYAAQLSATGGSPPYGFQLIAGVLPPGLALASSGALSGIPARPGTYAFTVEVRDASSCGRTRRYTITIVSPAGYLVGRGLGQPNENRVRLHDASGAPTPTDFLAYTAGTWGTNVAAGWIALHPDEDIVTGPGPGAVFGPHVRGFASDGAPLAKVAFFAYGTLRYGVNVGAAGVDADAFDEIETGAGPGVVFGPHVRGFDHDGGAVAAIPTLSFFAYGTLRYGVNVAAGRFDEDLTDELLTGPGPGIPFGPQVRGFRHSGGVSAVPGLDFLAISTVGYGVIVASGDVDADAVAELLAAPGPGPLHPARYVGFGFDGATVRPLPGFDVVRAGSGYGGRPGAGDVTGDGRSELHAGRGTDPAADASVVSYEFDGSALAILPNGFTPFPGFHGVNVTALAGP